jgi:peptidoglycan/LPS O-acetylase OafA/YrhL
MRSFTRDPRIDFIRGIAVISMVVQHVGGNSFLSFAFGAGAFTFPQPKCSSSCLV